MLIPIKLQINIQFNFLTITNHGRSRERTKAARPEASAGSAKLRKQRRPLEDVPSKLVDHVRVASDMGINEGETLTDGGVRVHARQRVPVIPGTGRRVVAVMYLTDARRAVGRRVKQVSDCGNDAVRLIHLTYSILPDYRRQAPYKRPMLLEGQCVTPCDCALARVHQHHGQLHSEDAFRQHRIHKSGLRGKRIVVSVETMASRELMYMKALYQ